MFVFALRDLHVGESALRYFFLMQMASQTHSPSFQLSSVFFPQCFLPDGCLAGIDFFFFHILFEICKCRLPRRLLTSLSCITAMLSPPAGLQSPIRSVGTGQQTAPSLPTSTPIDPSSMKRAYAALGLPYSNQSPTQTQSPAQTQGPGQPTAQTPHQQQMRPINALGKHLITLL